MNFHYLFIKVKRGGGVHYCMYMYGNTQSALTTECAMDILSFFIYYYLTSLALANTNIQYKQINYDADNIDNNK